MKTNNSIKGNFKEVTLKSVFVAAMIALPLTMVSAQNNPTTQKTDSSSKTTQSNSNSTTQTGTGTTSNTSSNSSVSKSTKSSSSKQGTGVKRITYTKTTKSTKKSE